MSDRGRRSVLSCSQQSANAEMSQTEQAEDGIECKVKLRDSERALQCNFCDNTFCYKCTSVSAKSYDAICKSSQEEGIQWFCIHCRISFNCVTSVTKITKK